MRGLWVVVAALAAACSSPMESNGVGECVDAPNACTPQYEPTFENIHSRTLLQSCAVSGGACHATPTASGGFSMTGADEAYDELTTRVDTDDPGCGTLSQRLYADDPAVQMPPGMTLSDGERCAIVQWIQDGAPR